MTDPHELLERFRDAVAEIRALDEQSRASARETLMGRALEARYGDPRPTHLAASSRTIGRLLATVDPMLVDPGERWMATGARDRGDLLGLPVYVDETLPDDVVEPRGGPPGRREPDPEPEEVITADAIRLPAGPVPLRWGTTGPVIGLVTLTRDDDGTIVVDRAPEPHEDRRELEDLFPQGISPVQYATRYGWGASWEPAPKTVTLAPDVLDTVAEHAPQGGYVVPRYFARDLLLEPGDLLEIGHPGNRTRYRVLDVDVAGMTYTLEPLAPTTDTPPTTDV